MEVDKILISKFKETLKFYKAQAFDAKSIPVLCRIHDAFGGNDGEHHNCLGCNFAESQELILKFLEKSKQYSEVKDAFTIYILTLYLLVERMDTVMEIVQVPTAYKEKHFKVFQQIRKWANFIKHPKAFVLTHHPCYDFEGSGIDWEQEFTITINDQFVTNYYKGESDQIKQKSKNKELYSMLSNKQNIKVLFPDMTQLVKKLCYSINSFKDLILKNQVYIDILNDEATIADYFENQEEGENSGN